MSFYTARAIFFDILETNLIRYERYVFTGAMGYISRINSVGDAEGNFSLVARRQIPGTEDQWGMMPVGVFQLNKNLSELPVSMDSIISTRPYMITRNNFY